MEGRLKWLLAFFALISVCCTVLAVVDTERIVDKVWLSPLCSFSSDEIATRSTSSPRYMTHSMADGTPPPGFEQGFEETKTYREVCKERVQGSTRALCSLAVTLSIVYVVYRVFFYKGAGAKARASSSTN